MANPDPSQSPPPSSTSTAASGNGSNNGSDTTANEQTPLLTPTQDAKVKTVEHNVSEDVVIVQTNGEDPETQIVRVPLTDEEIRQRMRWRIARTHFSLLLRSIGRFSGWHSHRFKSIPVKNNTIKRSVSH